MEYARDIKNAVSIPVMVTGGFRRAKVMNDALLNNDVDLIGVGRPFIVDPEFPQKLLDGLIDSAPSKEREFPPADELPRGAVLNWFCHQLLLHGELGIADTSLPVTEGHEHYLKRIEKMTEQLLRERGAQPY